MCRPTNCHLAVARLPGVTRSSDQADGSICFDIGGTSFRSGVLTADGNLQGVTSRPAISFVNEPLMSTTELQEGLVDYLRNEAARLSAAFMLRTPVTASVSMGAAMDSNTSMILDSGPLWGPRSAPFDLLHDLRERAPEFEWFAINDVSAAVIHHANLLAKSGLRRVALVTVSTGIALRTFDLSTNSIPVDSVTGLQGEIGHLEVSFTIADAPLSLTCDCGGIDHLNAFSSGRGIESIVAYLSQRGCSDWYRNLAARMQSADPQARLEPLADALRAGDRRAQALVRAAMDPLARTMLAVLTIDPQVERLIVTGGVMHGLAPWAFSTLMDVLRERGLYQASARHENFIESRVVYGGAGQHEGLRGAALAALRASHTPASGVAKDTSTAEGVRWSVHADRRTSFSVYRGAHPAFPVEQFSSPQVAFVDEKVLHAQRQLLEELVAAYQIRPIVIPVKAAEGRKTPDALFEYLRQVEDAGVPRTGCSVIAVGGGTLLDVVGLTASLYRRGVPYIRVPTTLLAMVDASIGAKVGVNFAGWKNRIGAYWPSRITLIEPRFLGSLDVRQLRNGLAECAKAAVAASPDLWHSLETLGPVVLRSQGPDLATAAVELIDLGIDAMLRELAPNLFESRLSRAMDLGHTVSPSIEFLPGVDILHGEAVALDIAMSTEIASHRGLLASSDRERILRVLGDLGLGDGRGLVTGVRGIINGALADASRHRGGRLRMPLPERIGRVTFVDDVTPQEFEGAIERLGW